MSFATRLQILIGEESISGFARRVELSEGLIRKYLKGSEPSLTKAHQYVTGNALPLDQQEQQRLIISGYQYLRAHKKADGYLDEAAMAAFLQRHPKERTPSASK
ncbi:XRE family transcriptional regulator [Vibrio furnissii]|uniref:XRE family transcriptional regulator n=1 Tax=Vibrio furnissii TaxID=29494 RepID=UPI0025744993|nr:XRE family transcriptional regulator [Vibrio furnissii]WJG23589.1 XRE family transcriptional regulator [Vibrio furnissii]